MITNPILPGFNPDPSICRVGDDYYIATSTFEWFPGVSIYHSKNLADWTLVARPLNRPDLLNMIGEPDSCGVWAPCLSWDDGKFWLCYTDVKRFDGNFKDTHNYLTTCETIDGHWSAPVYLNSSGFDPSLFHDDNGRKWYLNMIWDHRTDRTFFGGIVLQEYSVVEQKLVGPVKKIFPGSDLGFTEGPHLYRKNGYYYLMTAEGGTGYNHAVTIARSKTIDGPYEVDPAGPVISSRGSPDALLQRAGHGSLVETGKGEFYIAHLCSRPLSVDGQLRSPLGRETAIQKVEYTEDGWFRLIGEGCTPSVNVPLPDGAEASVGCAANCDYRFDGPLHSDFQWLRNPDPDEFMSLQARPGYLRLNGQESIGSWFRQALVARRQTDFSFDASTCVEFSPTSFQQMAGLTCYYNSHKFHYLYVGFDEDKGRCLGIMSATGDLSLSAAMPLAGNEIPVPEGPLYLK
ncbi:MAG: glycoside hydrolase family 43 protein, partial [bacterium]